MCGERLSVLRNWLNYICILTGVSASYDNLRRPLKSLRSLGVQRLIPDRFLSLQTRNVDELAEKLSWSRPHRIQLFSNRVKHASKVSYVPLTEMTLGELTFTGIGEDSLGSAQSAFI